jgi:outer membrane protein insertion porin family
MKQGETGSTFYKIFARLFLTLLFCLCFSPAVFSQNKYESLKIADIQITFEETGEDKSTDEQFRTLLRSVLGERYSVIKVRESLEALYDTGKIVSAKVAATEVPPDGVNLRFLIKRKVQAERVYITVADAIGEPVTEQELLLRLNLLTPGNSVTDESLKANADLIQTYLREHGYYSAEVEYSTRPGDRGAQVIVTFNVNPHAQARVDSFKIEVKDFDPARIKKPLKLKPGEPYSREKLQEDVATIRKAIIAEGHLAPSLDEPKTTFDADKNSIAITLTGEIGPKINVKVTSDPLKVSEKNQTALLPIKREGTIDPSAIEEGKRRLRNYFQERGYFFAEITPLCSVTPPIPKDEANDLTNNTEELCRALSSADLEGREVEINYQAELNRRLKLVDIRLEGTDKLTIPEISSVLETQKANLLGFIPKFGYGRGYTNVELLENDKQTIQALMRELGYRDATVNVRRGVSPAGEDLIITFVVREGLPTRIAAVEVAGNKVFTDDQIEQEMPSLVGKNFSRARMRNGNDKILELYTREGYFNVKSYFSFVELPQIIPEEKQVKIIYTIENEGKKVIINRVFLNGNADTKDAAIYKAIFLKPGNVLRAAEISASEQSLYATDAFDRVTIEADLAGEDKDGNELRDIVINMEEKKPRILGYGGGYSTDTGASGFSDIRHINLFGKLYQGGFRARVSQRQQLVQIDFLNPRFMRDGKDRFAPLTITAQYQRDSTVTRFFRSTIDRGTFGIVQRLDPDGNPVDTFGLPAGAPTINRFSLIAETQRTIDLKSRTIAFFRFRFEDVRLYNIESLLIADLLRPDRKVRISGPGASLVQDTRKNCNRKYTLLQIIARGEPPEQCPYSSTEPTNGHYLTVDYSLSLEQLGGNISFQKFQANYQTYFYFPRLNGLILAGRTTVGLANVWSRRTNFGQGQFASLNDILPISERFFSGGSTSLRGFEFESAGPRVAFLPQGNFFNSSGMQVFPQPFTVPLGGNALALANLEARLPLTNAVQVVPFYDGGNIFSHVGEIFKPRQVIPGDNFNQNLRALWTNTLGLGLRIKTPVGGSLAIDYGYMLNPPEFIIPQLVPPDTVYRVKQGQLHFRFSQIF